VDAFVEISSPYLLAKLRAELEDCGCSTEGAGLRGFYVLHEAAADDEEAFFELSFFVRAWAQSNGDVAVRLRREV
jgi:hypothetical protein